MLRLGRLLMLMMMLLLMLLLLLLMLLLLVLVGRDDRVILLLLMMMLWMILLCLMLERGIRLMLMMLMMVMLMMLMVVVMMVKVWRRWGRRRRRHKVRRWWWGRCDGMGKRHLVVRDAGRQVVLHAARRDVNAARRKRPGRLRAAGVHRHPGRCAPAARADGDVVLGHADGQRVRRHGDIRSVRHSDLLHVNKEGALRALKRQHSQTSSLRFRRRKPTTRVDRIRDMMTTTAVFAVSHFLECYWLYQK
jgi:hypothetical protein